MPRYLLKRMWGEVSDAEMADSARRMLLVAEETLEDRKGVVLTTELP